MGLLDTFTGKPAKDAAAANAAEYRKYGDASLGDLDRGLEGSLGAIDGAIDAYAPLGALGQKYGRGTDGYMDAVGLNGAEGNARAVDSFHAGPGYNFMVDEATDRGARAAARFSPGGNEIDSVTRIASGLADQTWDKHLAQLGTFMPQEAAATSGAAAGTAAGYGAKAGAYSTDATNRVGVRGNVASGIANSNTASAQAQMNANSQFWNGLMSLGGNVAKAAYGAPPTPARA